MTDDNKENIVELTGLKRSFTQGETVIEVLRCVDLTVKSGEIVALLGPSGSGKSTLLHVASDVRTRIRRDKLGFVYQFHHLLADFDAQENIILPQIIAGTNRSEAETRAVQLLEKLGLGQRVNHPPSKLSGGEQQRVAVARAIANAPKLVLADEPTGNLDEYTADLVLEEFIDLVRTEGSSSLIATHNERLARKMDRVVRLKDGVLHEV